MKKEIDFARILEQDLREAAKTGRLKETFDYAYCVGMRSMALQGGLIDMATYERLRKLQHELTEEEKCEESQ